MDAAPLSRPRRGPATRGGLRRGDRGPGAKKNELKPWQQKQWGMPEVSAEFVAGLEEVLALYAESSEPQRPKVTFDETHKPLSAETPLALAGHPGRGGALRGRVETPRDPQPPSLLRTAGGLAA